MPTFTEVYSVNFADLSNQNPLSDSGNWNTTTVPAKLQIVSGQAVDQTNFFGASLLNVALTSDQYCTFQIGVIDPNGTVYALIRTLSSNQNDGYALSVSSGFGGQVTVFDSSAHTTIINISPITVSPGDIFTFWCEGTTVGVMQNGVTLATATGGVSNTQTAQWARILAGDTYTDTSFATWEAGNATDGSPVSGNCGKAGATVSWTGTASGSTTADDSGNYTTSALADGPYVIAPTMAGIVFVPPTRSVVVSGAAITGVDFDASTGWSPGDCRIVPNAPEIQADGSVFYTGQTSCDLAVPGTDSREAGELVDSREDTPVNSRVNPNP